MLGWNNMHMMVLQAYLVYTFVCKIEQNKALKTNSILHSYFPDATCDNAFVSWLQY